MLRSETMRNKQYFVELGEPVPVVHSFNSLLEGRRWQKEMHLYLIFIEFPRSRDYISMFCFKRNTSFSVLTVWDQLEILIFQSNWNMCNRFGKFLPFWGRTFEPHLPVFRVLCSRITPIMIRGLKAVPWIWNGVKCVQRCHIFYPIFPVSPYCF